MSLPNFLVLGPPRTGTTWLFRCIYHHPQIYVPEVKEIHYFDERYGRGVEWYRSFFRNVPDSAIATGDLTPSYCAHLEAPARVRETLGDRIKLFVVFRDPVERAFSEYRMKRGAGRLRGSFLEALQTDRALVENSLYAKNLQRFRDYFADDRLYLLSYRLLNENPLRYISEFLGALGVGIEYRQEVLQQRINEGLSEVRLRRLYKVSTYLRMVTETVPLGRRLIWAFRERGFVRWWHSYASQESPMGCTQAERAVAHSYFADDLARLNSSKCIQFLGDDLSLQ